MKAVEQTFLSVSNYGNISTLIALVIFLFLLVSGTVSTAQSAAPDRISTGVLAISSNPNNRIPPVAAADETFTSFTLEPGVRVTVQRPIALPETTASHVILYLLPNGNTTEQAEGRTSSTGLDWHYAIQHIAAQTRRVRQLLAPRLVITAVVEADTLSWPAWRKAVPDSDARIGQMVEEIRNRAGGPDATIDLVAHSGGGSFIFGYINSQTTLPPYLKRIVFLDANYSYSDEDHHGDKLLAWLRAAKDHQLVVFAYDDRRITINGKPIVSDTGGTWRATDRMARRFEQEVEFRSGPGINDLQTSVASQILLARHPNPENKILHTVLVERNGFVYTTTINRAPLQAEDRAFYKDTETYRQLILP